MKKTLLTIAVTILMMVVGITIFLYSEGNLKIEKKSELHNKQVYIDGNLIEDSNWVELLGYSVKIDLYDSVEIEK